MEQHNRNNERKSGTLRPEWLRWCFFSPRPTILTGGCLCSLFSPQVASVLKIPTPASDRLECGLCTAACGQNETESEKGTEHKTYRQKQLLSPLAAMWRHEARCSVSSRTTFVSFRYDVGLILAGTSRKGSAGKGSAGSVQNVNIRSKAFLELFLLLPPRE